MDYEQSLFFLIVRREWSKKVRSRENKQNSRGLEATFDFFSKLVSFTYSLDFQKKIKK